MAERVKPIQIIAGAKLVRAATMCTIIALLAAPAAAGAEGIGVATGNELLATCSSEDRIRMSACIGYLQGFSHGVIVESYEAHARKPFCMPEQVTLGQVRDVVIQGLQRNPATRHIESSVLLMLLLQQAFPCPAS